MTSDLEIELTTDRPILVYNDRLLGQMMHHLQKQSILAIDTESNSLFAYYSRVCLIQLSAPIDAEVDGSAQTDASNRDSTARSLLNVVDFLIDPLRLSTEQVSAVGALIAQKKIEVVMHAAENDIILLQREFGFQFPSVFDTQLAARFLGWKQIGLAALLETQFGIISDKRMQRTNWGERPLSPQQIAYAQMDTHYLMALRSMQIAQLKSANRWEAAQDAFARLSQIRIEDYTSNDRSFWQMRASREIDINHSAVLEALWEWRESEAQRVNRPPFKVMNDDVLIQLASEQPAALNQLSHIRGLSEQQVGRFGQTLLRLIRTSKSNPLPALPESKPNPEQLLDKAARRRFDKLRLWRSALSSEIDLAPELIFTNQTLIEIAQASPQNIEALQAIADVGAWKTQTYGQSLLSALENL